MSKTRPSSSSMGATPPQRRAERVEHSQQHVRRGAEQPRGGARNAWGRKGERDGGRRSRGDEEENFFKSRPGSQKSRFSLPLQPESNCTIRDSTVDYSTRSFPGKQPDRSNQGKVLKFHFFWNRNFELNLSAKFNLYNTPILVPK